MIFDKELTFIETEPNALHNLESGQLGRVVCLGASGLGKGRKSSVAIAFKSDTTATGDPKISLELITADTDDFNDSVKIPLSLPTPIKKEQMAEGTVLAAPTPTMGLLKYVKLNITVDTPIACVGLVAGFVLDADER